MKTVEERLRDLPRIADSLERLDPTPALKNKIKLATRDHRSAKRRLRRLMPGLSLALLVVVAGVIALPRLGRTAAPTPVIDTVAAGGVTLSGEQSALLDVPQGSITIRQSKNPSYRSIWASGSGASFPVIGISGRYYRMLTNPTSLGSDLLGDALGSVDNYTSEPALAGTQGIISNIVGQNETVYAVSGMRGAAVAARVNGVYRVFQRVSFGDRALVGGESLSDTLRASSIVAIELSGVGTVNDKETAKHLYNTLIQSAEYQRAGGSETGQSLLIQLNNGLVLQMAVNGERVIACGTWACPDFFEAFTEALQ